MHIKSDCGINYWLHKNPSSTANMNLLSRLTEINLVNTHFILLQNCHITNIYLPSRCLNFNATLGFWFWIRKLLV